MGIKGVYGEIGPGTRTALLKLAVEKKEQEGRNLRIAIDFSIWQHQVQLGRGGTNADLRTLFYRSLRLLRLSIEPLFVFDGPHKPPFKRNKKTSQNGGSALQLAAIELFKLLGFPYITAPGEAEAECALLQKEGLVDAVLSEDVDTLMFGCTMHLRSWGAEDPKSKGTATHVDVYKANEIISGASGLDREGMVLVALMSGGDYLPAGIPNCGIKIACEAARAGFGSDLARIDQKDSLAIRAWRDRLQHELQTNDSRFFRTKHKTLQVPDHFPDKAVLYYYTTPVVSTSQQLERYRKEIEWREPDVVRFWQASKTFFDWQGSEGLRHFVRNMAPALMGWRLANATRESRCQDNMTMQSEAEEQLVKTICGRRMHASAGNVPELRLSYIPQDIVGISLDDIEESELNDYKTHTAEYNADEEGENNMMSSSNHMDVPLASKKRVTASYDATKVDKDWFPEGYARIGIPTTFKKWEEEQKDPIRFATRKARAREKEKAAMPQGAIERYFPKSKPQSMAQSKESSQGTTPMQDKRTDMPRGVYVSSNLNPSLDDSLTSIVTSIPFIAPPTRQTMQKSKPAIIKVTETVTTLKEHVRVTKPNVTMNADQSLASRQEDDYHNKFLGLDLLLSRSLVPSTKHARSPSPTRNLQLEEPPVAIVNTQIASQPIGRPLKKTAIKNLAGIDSRSVIPMGLEKAPILSDQLPKHIHTSVKVDEASVLTADCGKPTTRRSPFTRTISAPTQHTQFKPRPTYNPWKSIDDFDASFESLKTPTQKGPITVDLTLS